MTLQDQHEHIQYEDVDDLYDFHAQMEVHQKAPMDI
jgi:hypothetical protein